MSQLYFLPVLCLVVFGMQVVSSKTVPHGHDPNMIEGAALKIASFNVRVFGTKKMADPLVKDVLIKIILRYDIILIQEIRSTDDDAINELLEGVNRFSSPPGIYKMALSARLGRTNSKEQYAFIYRSDRVSHTDDYIFDDGDESTGKDKFEREPFIVRFTGYHTYVTDFALAAIHTSPSKAVSEIDRLVDVYNDITQRWKLKDVMILGDFNSGCSYVRTSNWPKIRLATDRRFYWLISNDADTTVGRSDCAYDRMVVAGDNMIRGIFADSAKVFNYKQFYNLNQEQAEDVSDHFPIEVQFKDSTFRDEEEFFSESITVTNHDGKMAKVSKYFLYSLRSTEENPLLSQGFTLNTTYTKKGAISEITIGKPVDMADVAKEVIDKLGKVFPSLVSNSQIAVSGRLLSRIERYQTVHCSVEESSEAVFQMLSNQCSGLKIPRITGVQLVCSTSSLSCKIAITADLSSFRL